MAGGRSCVRKTFDLNVSLYFSKLGLDYFVLSISIDFVFVCFGHAWWYSGATNGLVLDIEPRPLLTVHVLQPVNLS